MNEPQYQNTQTIQTPSYSQPQARKSGANTQYISSIPGIIHLLLIVSMPQLFVFFEITFFFLCCNKKVFLFPCWVSIAAVPKTGALSIVPRSPLENAYLFFAITAFLIEIALFIIHLFDVHKINSLSSLPWFLIVRLDYFCFNSI